MATKAEEVMSALTEFQVGDRVLVHFANSRKLMPATIQRAYSDHTFEVLTADGYHLIRSPYSMVMDPHDGQ